MAFLLAAGSALHVLLHSLRSGRSRWKACCGPPSYRRGAPTAACTAPIPRFCTAVPTKTPASDRQVVFPAKLSISDDTRFLQVCATRSSCDSLHIM